MSPMYKLKYFDFMGVAEPIRYLFAYGGIKYENVVINKDVEWNTFKKTIPFGKVPVLMVDDKVLFQSVAISRYLGHQLGLMPTTDDTGFYTAELDAIACTVYDFGTRVHEWYHETNKEKKAVWFHELEEEVIPVYMRDFEEWASKKGGFFGGNKVTWVDFYFVGIMESVQGMWGQEMMQKKYPTLYQLYTNVRSFPAIKSYINSRPNYKY